MANLIRDPQNFVLAEYLKDEIGQSSLATTHNVIENGFNSLNTLFNKTSLSEFLLFNKLSASSTKDSFNVDEINNRNINYSLRYNSNDTTATSREVYLPINNKNFNPKNYLNSWFTINMNLVTAYSGISNQSLGVSIIVTDGTTEVKLSSESFPIYYNSNYNISAHQNYRLFKNYSKSFKTLKTDSLYFKNFSDNRDSFRVYLVLTLPNSASPYSINFANLFLSFGKDKSVEFSHFSKDQLESKSRIETTLAFSYNQRVYNDSIVDRDSVVRRDLQVDRNATIDGDLKVVGDSNLGETINMYNSSGLLLGSIKKTGSLIDSKFIFENGDSTRAGLDATSLQTRYADVAEFFKCSTKLEKGDIVQVSKKLHFSIEKCTRISKSIGVISTNPAVKLNSSLEVLDNTADFCILPVGYLGIIPVKIIGKIKSGQYIKISKKAGTGKKSFFKTNIISLELSNDIAVKKINCLIN